MVVVRDTGVNTKLTVGNTYSQLVNSVLTTSHIPNKDLSHFVIEGADRESKQ